jgi:hypothetical protein
MQFEKLNQINAELSTDRSDRLTLIRSGVPDNPFRGNWYKPVINNFLVKAAQEGKGGIGFPVGQIIADRYNLRKWLIPSSVENIPTAEQIRLTIAVFATYANKVMSNSPGRLVGQTSDIVTTCSYLVSKIIFECCW